jgi:DNA-binding GntR family transcriptional regulator
MEFTSGRTKRDQVADEMRRRIGDGSWPVGQSVGDLFKLEKEFGVSWGTVRAAEEILVSEGLLSEVRAGVPTRVIAQPARTCVDEELLRLRAVHRDLGNIIANLESRATDGD